ncbi:hypothetical protein HZY86_01155 [Aerococcaceae bacterium DSM 111020]|nr:hypothetical protein [Aerococcaceae bacterium DSM 111020]
MVEILKNLAPEQVTAVLIALGIVREARLLIKSILDYKLELRKLAPQEVKDEAI